MYIVKSLWFYSTHTVSKFGKMLPSNISFYHLVFLIKGKMTYTADGVTYNLEENDALFLPKGTLRSRDSCDEPAQYVIFNFIPYDSAELNLETHIKSALTPNIKKLLAIYPYSYSNSSDFTTNVTHEKEKTRQIMQNILNCVLIELMDNQRYNTKNPHVLKAIKFINDNITAPLSLKDVSQSIHLSKEYTAKIFKEEMGCTVTEYINEKKMLIAKDMLNSDEVTLRDTALNLGFENYSYFSRIFKKHFNTSPAKVKKSMKTQ